MKTRILFIVCLTACLMASCSDKKTVLFNGKDLTGWKCVTDPKSDADPSQTFTVKDGVILISGTPFGYMRTTEKYEDYTLHTEWRWVNGKADSGIFNRLQEGDKVWPTGIQMQMEEHSFGTLMGGIPLKDAESRGNFYMKKPTETKVVEKTAGEWNETEIVCKGGHISVTVNGILTNEADCEVTSGYIALQSEGGPIEFRNVYIVKE